MSTIIDLATLQPTEGFIIQGDTAGDNAGFSVSNAGDINGDGIDDFIVGAWSNDDGGPLAGEAYVIFGKAGAVRPNIDLTALAPTEGFVIQGGSYDRAGFSVARAGDVNGDGIDDLLVGAPYGDNSGVSAGDTYVIFGKSGATRANIDLANLANTDGFSIQGDANYDRAGGNIATAGDVNGDGFDDIIIGARFGDNGGNNAGEAYVIFGKAGATRANIALANLTSIDGFIIQGDAAGDQAGRSVASAGDINGDGIDDLIIGAPYGDVYPAENAGKAYVIFGKTGAARANIDLTNLSPGDGFVIGGADALDLAGMSVSSAGDINGDGIDDLIVGAPLDDSVGGAGQAYIIFGRQGAARANIVLNFLAATDGFAIRSEGTIDNAGISVAAAGDIDGDGFDDLIVASSTNGRGGPYAGAAYIIFGKAGATRGDIPLFNLAMHQGVIIQGRGSEDIAGSSVSGAGDFNGDGFADVLVGAPGNDVGGTDAGAAYVIYGRVALTAPGGILTGSIAPEILNGTILADQISGLEGNDVIYAGSGDDELDGGIGADMLDGGLGNDLYYIDDVGDVVVDAGGIDIVITSVSYILSSGLENLTLTGAGTLQASGNGSNNLITANSGVSQLSGLGGGDVFVFGANLTAVDTVDGGTGNDQVGIAGNYTGGDALVLNATTLTNVEVLALLPGIGNGYNITMHDGNVAAGVEMTIFAGNLGTGQNFTFNGSGETDGFFRTFGGLGTDTITGGTQSDGFYFGPGKWQAGDSVVGGLGGNDQLALDGDYTLTIGASADVEVLVLLASPDGGNPNDFNVTLSDAWAGAGQTRTVFGRNLTTAAVINGSAESAANLTFFGGRAGDTLTGGAGSDQIYGLEGNDAITGGAGSGDIAVYQGQRASYSIVTGGGSVQIVDNDAVTDGNDGTDTVVGIEFARFADQTISITSPIILDLDGGGVETLSADQSNAAFDMDGDGIGDDTSWFGRGEGLLFLDRDGNGTLSNAGEMSFTNDVANARSDLEGLAAWDSNGDGVLSKQDKRFTSFKIWRDRDGDGVVDRREVMTLRQAGVRSLSLSGTANNGSYALGDTAIVNTGSFTRTNGRRGGFIDAVLTAVSSKGDTETAAQRALVTDGDDPLDAMRAGLAAGVGVTSDSFDPRVTVMTQDMASFGGSAHAIATDMDRWRQQGTASMDVFAA